MGRAGAPRDGRGGLALAFALEQPRTAGDFLEEEIDGIHYIWLKTPDYHGNGISRAATSSRSSRS